MLSIAFDWCLVQASSYMDEAVFQNRIELVNTAALLCRILGCCFLLLLAYLT